MAFQDPANLIDESEDKVQEIIRGLKEKYRGSQDVWRVIQIAEKAISQRNEAFERNRREEAERVRKANVELLMTYKGVVK